MKRSELKADPEKTRAWQQRSRDNAAKLRRAFGREGAKSNRERRDADWDTEKDGPFVRYSTSTLRPGKQRKKVTIPAGVRTGVIRRSNGQCVMCLHLNATDPEWVVQPVAELHHVLPKRLFPDLVKRFENLVGLCRQCHANHEHGARDEHRIPAAALPACCSQLATAVGGQALTYFDRIYLGAPSLPNQEAEAA